MDSVTPVTDETFDEEVRNAEVPVCSSTTGRPGARRAARWRRSSRSLADENAGDIKIVKVDVDREPLLADAAGVEGLPTLVLYQGGREVRRLVGARPKHVLEMELGLADGVDAAA
jgi:thioredoxin 1